MKTEIRLRTPRYFLLDNYKLIDGSLGWDHSSNWEWSQDPFLGSPSGSLRHITGNTDTLTQTNINVTQGIPLTLWIRNNNFMYSEPKIGSINISFGGVNSYDVDTIDHNGAVIVIDVIVDGDDLIITPSSDCNIRITLVHFRANRYSQTINRLDLYDDFGMNLNMSVNDIRDVSKRNSAYSKTIKIPGSKNNNNIFKNLLDINSDTSVNDNYLYKPVEAEIYYDSVLVRSGYIKPTNITKSPTPEYEIQFYGEYANLAATLGDQKIFNNNDASQDIDVSDINHYFTFSGVQESWTNLTTSGYTYPLIDYVNANGNIHYMSNLRPAISSKVLFDRIISDAGFTYESNFLSGDPFTNMVCPWTGAKVLADQDRLYDNRIIRTYRNNNYIFVKGAPVIQFDNEYTDSGDQYNNTGSVVSGVEPWSFKIKNEGKYLIRGGISFYMRHTYDHTQGAHDFQVRMTLSDITEGIDKQGSLVSITVPADSSGIFSATGNTTFDQVVELKKDHQYQLKLGLIYVHPDTNITILGGWPAGSEGATFFKVFPEDIFSFDLYEGDYVDMQNLFGSKEVKKIDYITSIVKMFNLIVDEDPLKYKHLIFSTNEDYYSGGTYLDWTEKVDVSQPIEITKLTEYVDKSAYLSYKKDDDTLNEEYTNTHSLIYGEKTHYNETKSTDLIKIEPIFSPTPLDYYGDSIMIVSKIFEYDYGEPFDSTDDTLEERDFNPRILYYNHIPIQPGNVAYGALKSATNNIVVFDYAAYPYLPYAGHLDNPYDSESDFDFGNNPTYFFDTTGNTITHKNLWWRYYRNFFDRMLDHDSKLVKMRMNLNEFDISNFRFRDTIRIDNTSYVVNKITNWNPNTTCDVELLKLSNNYLRFRSGDSGIPVDAYRTKNKEKKNTISLVKPDRTFMIYSGLTGETFVWDTDEFGEFPGTYKNSNIFDDKSNCVISGVQNTLNNTFNTQIVGDNNNITGVSGTTCEDIIIIGNNNTII